MSSESGSGNGSGGSSGLLSKVVKFVKSPTTHWSDLDRPETESGDTQSRLALKEMIERKRRNDFVRNREFDMLRKLRRRETLTDEDALPGQASFYPSSQPANTGERARTLEKIDEIEAQMSTAWFRRKGSEVPGVSPDQKPVVESQMPAVNPYGKTDPMPLHTGEDVLPTSRGDAPLEPVAVRSFAPTEQMNYADFEAELARRRVPSAGEATDTTADAGLGAPSVAAAVPNFGAFGGPTDFQVDVVVEAKLDPAIEEAAIRFANGDADGAEAGLRDLVADGGEREDDVDTWLTLFDLYRATGEQDKFDDAALNFAARFGRSAPQWGTEGESGSRPVPVAPAAAVAGAGARFHWSSPPTIGVQSVAALNATLTRNAPPWRVDWRHLKAIDPAALPALHDVLQRWATSSVSLKFLGAEQLLQVLTQASPTDDRQVDPLWWETRLVLLRVLGEMDEFELVALNYCVTYEVSPPAWEDPKNSYSPLTDSGDTMPPPEAELTAALAQPSRTFAATDVMGAPNSTLDDSVVRAELTGELVGSADSALKPVRTSAGTSAVEVNCRSLLRVDFGAAGDLLNWAMDHKSNGRQVSFKQVNRLVAAFFGVIGINDAARVILRVD